ncbi:MAG: serine/threonine-protein kinase [Myxococcales bacterium]
MATPPTGFPQAFGKYRLLRKLARGGMAELFLATDQAGLPVVIKRVLPHFTQETEFLKMFLNEARIAALLNHPGIVKVFDLGMEGEHLYIAMEFVDGFDLETLTKLSGGKMPPAIAARVGADVCDALFYANRMTDLEGKPLNVVHRDVTPGNVMVTRRGQVKLVDFGVAKAAAQLERTRPGVVKGKFRYMSPEQINFKELDGRSDLFSLGVLLYEVCTGDRPFERKQLLDIINALMHYDPPPPAEVVKGFPKQLSIVIMHALEKDRETRYKHGREMQQALEQAIRATPTTSAELAGFIVELAKKHPKELAPVAPEFGGAAAVDRPQATDPARLQPGAEGEETAKLKGAKASSATNNKATGELRTEALSGDQVKRMIAEADRRHAASSGRTPAGGSPAVRNSGRQPFSVGPPEEQEATALALGDDNEETTTDPIARRRPPTSPAVPALPSVRKSGPHPPVPPESPPPPARGALLDEEEPKPNEEGPDTLRVRQPARSSQRVSAPARPSTPKPSPSPAAASKPFDPREFGDDDDLDVPTISNVRRPDRPAPPVAENDPDDEEEEEQSQVSAVSSVTAAERRVSSRSKVLLAVLIVAALALLGWFAMVSFAPQYVPEQLRDGASLAKQPLAPPGQESPADKPEGTAKAEQAEPAAPASAAAADSGETEEAASAEEPEPSGGAAAADPAPDAPKGTVSVEGSASARVSIGGRSFLDVPFQVELRPGPTSASSRSRAARRSLAARPKSKLGKKSVLKVR